MSSPSKRSNPTASEGSSPSKRARTRGVHGWKLASGAADLEPKDLFRAWSKGSAVRHHADLERLITFRGTGDVAEAHKLWLQARHDLGTEIAASRYPKRHSETPKATTVDTALRIVKTLELLLGKIDSRKRSQLYRRVLQVHVDYVMLLYAMLYEEGKLEELRKRFRDLIPTMKWLLDRLNESGSGEELQQDAQVLALEAQATSGEQARPKHRKDGPRISAAPSLPTKEDEVYAKQFLVDASNVKSLDTISGNAKAKEMIEQCTWIPKTLTRLRKEHPDDLTSQGLLLYGAPGTGKTLLARSIAKELPLFSVKSSDIIDKWVGSSERNLASLFTGAGRLAPSAIFTDEVHSFCNQRQVGTDSTLNVATDLLQLMSEYSNVLVIGATNYPWLLDRAFIRRFEMRVHVCLPGDTERSDLLQRKVVDYQKPWQAKELDRLIEASKGLTGDMITTAFRKVVRGAAMNLRHATHFQKTTYNGRKGFRPTSQSSQAAIPREDVVIANMTLETLKLDVLVKALKEVQGKAKGFADLEAKHARWSVTEFTE